MISFVWPMAGCARVLRQIKFIVDGVWKVDPTRPITYTKSGNENNVLLVKQ